MNLDEKFPLPKREDWNKPVADYYPSKDLPLLFSTRVGHYPCHVCGKLTTWVILHDGCRNHVCSEECMREILAIPETAPEKPKVLVVEDDPDMRELVAEALEPVAIVSTPEPKEAPQPPPVAALEVPPKAEVVHFPEPAKTHPRASGDPGTSPCKYCGSPIPKSGRKGRPPTICDACKARIAAGEVLTERKAE